MTTTFPKSTIAARRDGDPAPHARRGRSRTYGGSRGRRDPHDAREAESGAPFAHQVSDVAAGLHARAIDDVAGARAATVRGGDHARPYAVGGARVVAGLHAIGGPRAGDAGFRLGGRAGYRRRGDHRLCLCARSNPYARRLLTFYGASSHTFASRHASHTRHALTSLSCSHGPSPWLSVAPTL